MATSEILTGEPEYRPQGAARILDCCTRTIRRESLLKKFPEPDGHEWWKGRWVPVWKLSTLRAYRESKMKRPQ
jgi:hypothetical protein